MNRTRAFFSRDRVKRLERRRDRLLALLAENRTELEIAYNDAEDACGFLFIKPARTFDDFPECEKPGVVVPIRGRGK